MEEDFSHCIGYFGVQCPQEENIFFFIYIFFLLLSIQNFLKMLWNLLGICALDTELLNETEKIQPRKVLGPFVSIFKSAGRNLLKLSASRRYNNGEGRNKKRCYTFMTLDKNYCRAFKYVFFFFWRKRYTWYNQFTVLKFQKSFKSSWFFFIIKNFKCVLKTIQKFHLRCGMIN